MSLFFILSFHFSSLAKEKNKKLSCFFFFNFLLICIFDFSSFIVNYSILDLLGPNKFGSLCQQMQFRSVIILPFLLFFLKSTKCSIDNQIANTFLIFNDFFNKFLTIQQISFVITSEIIEFNLIFLKILEFILLILKVRWFQKFK